MSDEMALLDCTFGWGKTCRLFADSIEIAGKSYNLKELTSIHPTYRKLFGIPSARVELFFGSQRLTLRGISEPEIARSLVKHLLTHCVAQAEPEHHRPRSAQARDLARAQARAWERSNKVPASTHPLGDTLSRSEDLTSSAPVRSGSLSQKMDIDESPLFANEEETLSRPAVEKPDSTEQPTSMPAICKLELEQPTSALAICKPEPEPRPAREEIPRLEPTLRSVHLVTTEQKKLNSCSMPAIPALKSSVLPVIHVPVRLQPGECAHYSIGATLCSDRLSDPVHAPYLPLDYGLLILTNRRIFYIGKHSQLILPYTRLWYVSLLYAAVALHVEGQFRRIIIEVEHAQEWASRIDQLAFIARRAPVQPVRLPLTTNALLALKPASEYSTTLKRPAVSTSSSRPEGSFSPNGPLPLCTARIVEANTIDLEPSKSPASAHEFLPSSQSENSPNTNGPLEAPQEPYEFHTSALSRQEAQEFDEFHTSTPGELLAPADGCFNTEVLAEQPTQQFGLSKSDSLSEQPTLQFDYFANDPLDELPTQQMSNIQNSKATESLNRLSSQFQGNRTAQVVREVLEGSTDIKLRRMPRDRARKRV